MVTVIRRICSNRSNLSCNVYIWRRGRNVVVRLKLFCVFSLVIHTTTLQASSRLHNDSGGSEAFL